MSMSVGGLRFGVQRFVTAVFDVSSDCLNLKQLLSVVLFPFW